MKIKIYLSAFILMSIIGRGQSPKANQYINSNSVTLKERIKAPVGYSRVTPAHGSFAAYLQNIKLKPDGTPVRYYNGKIKDNNGVYVAVIDLNIGNQDLQQCADVIMHVRAEYLFYTHQENKIHFTFTNGFKVDYSKWMEGYRIKINGNKTVWVKTAMPSNTYKTFCDYMDVVYNYCGTLSLSKELVKVNYADMQPGDILIKGGSPGHAELVMDMAQNPQGRKVYLLSQSYMPAQDMQVLQNPSDPKLSPWYALAPENPNIATPEWDFTTSQLMRFNDN